MRSLHLHKIKSQKNDPTHQNRDINLKTFFCEQIWSVSTTYNKKHEHHSHFTLAVKHNFPRYRKSASDNAPLSYIIYYSVTILLIDNNASNSALFMNIIYSSISIKPVAGTQYFTRDQALTRYRLPLISIVQLIMWGIFPRRTMNSLTFRRGN